MQYTLQRINLYELSQNVQNQWSDKVSYKLSCMKNYFYSWAIWNYYNNAENTYQSKTDLPIYLYLCNNPLSQIFKLFLIVLITSVNILMKNM